MAGYSVHIAFYAVALRGDDLDAALSQLAPIAARYGSSHWAVYRSADDRYKFLVTADFADKHDFQKFWYGEEAKDFRIGMQGSYQNPIAYVIHTISKEGSAIVTTA